MDIAPEVVDGLADLRISEVTSALHRCSAFTSTRTLSFGLCAQATMSTTHEISPQIPDETIDAEHDIEAEVDESVILRGVKLWVVFCAMLLSIFLIALE